MLSLASRAIDEIARERALRYYGVCLALVHTLTYIFWFNRGSMLAFLSDRVATFPICWPFFPSCYLFEPPKTLLIGISTLYLFGSILAAWWFWRGRVSRAWWALLVLNLVKWGLLAMDYRAMGNYHYMPFLISLAFLFVPGKSNFCRLLLVGFYLAAGALKLNVEWLSGQALFGQPAVTGIWLEWLCIGAVLIETVFVWGLLARDNVIRHAALVVLVVFHVFSYHIVGYFYPGIMFLLLMIFPLAWYAGAKSEERPAWRVRPLHAALLALFAVCQVIPCLQDGDPALVSRGRLYALNMFDALARCQSTIIVKFTGESFVVPADVRSLAPRVACDPIVYWNQARQLCRENAGREGFLDVDVLLSSRRVTELASTPVMAVRDFCKTNPSYNTLWPNPWMTP